ncbi:MAG: hypothetical protein L3K26_10705 [Candidatus Hydrogenedentes bacterium]|nr:hypothetical protein [Candidatus Hydrogenedentota bacterium]
MAQTDTSITRRQFGALTTLAVLSATGKAHAALEGPKILKLGTIDVDLVETTPVVFNDRVYRYEYVREKYKPNTTGDSYSRFVDHETGEATPAFAQGHHLGSAAVDGDLAIVTAVDIWDGEKVDIFVSRDLKTWESWNALNLPGYGMFNTSLCRDPEGYVLMFEVGKPKEVAGNRFTARFARSKDLKTWTLTAPECVYAKNRYTAPHCLRYVDGYYYDFYLESMKGGYAQSVVRSKDLIEWEQTPIHPFLMWGDEDKKIANPKLTEEQRKHIAASENRNNSDFDYCEFEGKLIINYSWGNQRGLEFLAEARYDGTEKKFLAALFP